MAFATLTYSSLDGATDQFDVTFPYISASDVKVFLNGSATTAFSFLTTSRIQMNSMPASGSTLVVKRATSQTSRLVDYQTGGILSEDVLDTDSLQAFYMAQEAIDITDATIQIDNATAQWTSENLRITNLATPTSDQDAATKAYADTQSVLAAGSASAASTSAAAALVSENASAASAAAAAASETAAGVSETNAAASYDAFDDRYLGSKASDPTLDNDGDALIDGALYWNTTDNNMYVYDLGGTAWVTVSNNATSVAAAASASAASTSETNAANSASAASTSASNASTSETNAEAAKDAAVVAQAAAEAALDEFTDTYLGAKASDPTVDNDGNPLTTGDQYFNTSDNVLKIWNGSSWQAAALSADDFVSKTSGTGSAILPAGSTAERDGSPLNGYLRYNSDDNQIEGYISGAWGQIGGGAGYFKGENGTVGSSAGDIFRINEAELNTDVTIDAGENASATGPLGVASGATLTVSGTLVII